MKIHCCTCKQTVDARLTDGREIYPHRQDLASLPFWRCDGCRCFVGCHHKTKESTRPLGCIPSPKIKNARKQIHAILDPLWMGGKYKRKALYKLISGQLGYEYHSAEIRTIEQARTVYRVVRSMY